MQQWFTTSEARISATIRDDFKEVDQADEVTPGDEVTPIYGKSKFWSMIKSHFLAKFEPVGGQKWSI